MNHLGISIILFIFIFGLIIWIQPTFIYNKDGSLRQFGVGYRKKTVFPLWLVVFILAIFCYHGGNFIYQRYI
jgi:hypothetical protein